MNLYSSQNLRKLKPREYYQYSICDFKISCLLDGYFVCTYNSVFIIIIITVCSQTVMSIAIKLVLFIIMSLEAWDLMCSKCYTTVGQEIIMQIMLYCCCLRTYINMRVLIYYNI